MIEIFIERKSGEIENLTVEELSFTSIKTLMEDNDVVSFLVVKALNNEMQYNAHKKCALKNIVSSVRRKDYINSKKREKEENDIIRKYRREKFLEKNKSLPEVIGRMLSVCSLNAQKVFWAIKESDKLTNREIICEVCVIASRTADIAIKELTDHNLIQRIGSKKTGHYIVKDEL